MILQFILLFFALLCNECFAIFFHLLIVNLMLTKGFFESTCRNLINKIALVFESFLLLGQFLRLVFLIIFLLHLKIERLGLVNFFVSLGSLCNLCLALFTMFLNLIKHGFMTHGFFLSDHFLNLSIYSLLLFYLLHISVQGLLAALLFALLSHLFLSIYFL